MGERWNESMTSDLHGNAAAESFELLVKVSMDMEVFSSNWAYCDRLSSYIAKMISHNRTDSLLYSNLFSSALNELLETAHRAHGRGEFVCSVSRRAEKDLIELKIPCDAAGSHFYREAMSRLSQPDVGEQYRAALFSDGPLDPSIGLLELAVDYRARLAVEPAEESAVRLSAELSLEEDEG
ncbi:ubiquinone biosynthesis methyltransferase UbiE [Nitratireductor sp. GCM10026969]|uniref:ubiquinone biosynthesis methyltransferase UbiE n=1 Tax=Nitratireductor sp. GCM10026969 TaxID=3252645 RepID=UPI00361CC887